MLDILGKDDVTYWAKYSYSKNRTRGKSSSKDFESRCISYKACAKLKSPLDSLEF